MFPNRIARAGLAAVVALVVGTSGVIAGQPESAWFNGHQVGFRIPAGDSSDPNQFTFACFAVGPDLSRTNRSASWSIVLALPGPNFTSAAMPYTSAAAVRAGVSAGQLVLVDAGFRTIAPVSGG